MTQSNIPEALIPTIKQKSRSHRHSGPHWGTVEGTVETLETPITSPHRPNMSEVVAFVGISQRDILSRRNMISYQQSKAERSHATSNTPTLVTTRDRCTNRINFKKRPLRIRSFLQKPIILWPLYSLYNFEFLTSIYFRSYIGLRVDSVLWLSIFRNVILQVIRTRDAYANDEK